MSDSEAGIRRVRRGRGFAYIAPGGGPVDVATKTRIVSLAIPPAWTDVWICEGGDGHIQATGRDARGRKQYRYHHEWTSSRSAGKFEGLAAFARILPRLRRIIERDLADRSDPEIRAVATAAWLLDATLIRVGNDEYRRTNGSFGLTTLTREHARVCGTEIRFEFVGKSGKTHSLSIRDRRIARIIRTCQELPGQRLLQYQLPDGCVRHVSSEDVNRYLARATGAEFTARTFRTWGATVEMVRALSEQPLPGNSKEARKVVNEAYRRVAARLGNTVAVCKSSYVAPAVVEAYLADEYPRNAARIGKGHPDLSAPEYLARRLLR